MMPLSDKEPRDVAISGFFHLRNAPNLSHLRGIEGKLDVLRVECTKCDRKGRYHVHKLIEKYGRWGNMMKWRARC
jgi:hypothetical protein